MRQYVKESGSHEQASVNKDCVEQETGLTRRLAPPELKIFDKATADIQSEFIRQAESAGLTVIKNGRTRNLPSSKDTGRFLLNYHTKSIRHFVSRELIKVNKPIIKNAAVAK